MKNNKRKLFVTTILMFLFALCIAPITAFAATEIGDIEIENVKFNYDPGDAPQVNATPMDGWYGLYNVEYECWEEMETNEKGESVPVKFWYSDESKNNALAQDKKITTFEDGKTYMYSISLKTEDDNTFAVGKTVKINGAYVDNKNVTNSGTRLFVVAVKTIKPETITYQHISEVEINNATISFKVGDKPAFSGTTPENIPYIYQSEFWSTDGGKKYYYAADFWNINNPDDLFNKFESGKSYTYGIYFKAAEGYCFTTDTKLKINGKYYDYDTDDYDPMLQYNEGEYATMWVDTSLIITPTSSEQPTQDTVKEIESSSSIKGSITFEKEVSKNYTLDIKQVEVSKNLSDKNVKYLVDINVLENGQVVKISDTKMKIRIALPEDLKGYKKYEVVYISNDEIKETIPATIEDGYILFETSHLSEYGIVATNETINNDEINPSTGDNIKTYVILSLISVIGITSCYSLRKRFN
mgnify:CR=1 FL=1